MKPMIGPNGKPMIGPNGKPFVGEANCGCCGLGSCDDFNAWLATAGLSTADVTLSATENPGTFCVESCGSLSGSYILAEGTATGACDAPGANQRAFAVAVTKSVGDCGLGQIIIQEIALQLLCGLGGSGTMGVNVGVGYRHNFSSACGLGWGTRHVPFPCTPADFLSGEVPVESDFGPCMATAPASYSIS